MSLETGSLRSDRSSLELGDVHPLFRMSPTGSIVPIRSLSLTRSLLIDFGFPAVTKMEKSFSEDMNVC